MEDLSFAPQEVLCCNDSARYLRGESRMSAHQSDATVSAPPRRYCRFGCAILVLVALLSGLLWWIIVKVPQARIEGEAVEAIHAIVGAKVRYLSSGRCVGWVVHCCDPEIDDKAMEFLSPHLQTLGISQLFLYDSGVTDAGLPAVSRLTTLRRLYFNGTQITDAGLEHIKTLTRLEQLGLSRTRVTGTGFHNLRNLETLKLLDLEDTPVSAESIAELQKCLPDLYINRGWPR